MEAYRPPAPGGWASVPDDGYVYQHLAYHMSEAGLGDELRGLLLDFDWLEAKLRATDLAQLLADFGRLPGDETISLVRDAVRLSGHHLVKDPTLLHSQLHGRLLGVDSPEIKRLLQRPSGRALWLRCLSPSLTGPGGALILSLEGHADSVSAVAVTRDGTRAVSASDDKTLKVWDLATGQLLHDLEGHADAVSSRGGDARRQEGRLRLRRQDAEGVGPGHRPAPARPPRTRRLGQCRGGDARRQEGRLRLRRQDAEGVGPGVRALVDMFATDYALWCCDVSPTGDTLVAAGQGGRVHFLRYEDPGLGP